MLPFAGREGDARVVQHLEKEVEDEGMRLLDLVKEERSLRDAGQRTAEQPDFTGLLADQFFDGGLILIFGHIEANGLQTVEKVRGENIRQFGLPDAGRPHEKERAFRARRVGEPQFSTRQHRRHTFEHMALATDVGFQMRSQPQ